MLDKEVPHPSLWLSVVVFVRGHDDRNLQVNLQIWTFVSNAEGALPEALGSGF